MGGVENPYYPLALPIWQATTATINRGWNDIIARSFGPIFFFALIAIIWQSVWQLTRKRSLSCASALVAACLPLNAWHAVSGYADIAIEVFAVASITMLLQKRLLPAGLLAAATGWIKNDGLFIYMPAILIMAIVFLYTPSELIRINIFQKHKIKKICFFLAGYTTLVPWYVFKLTHRPSVPASEQGTALNWSETITSFSDKFAWHPSAPALLIKYVLLGPTHYIFWPFVFCTSIIALPSLLRNTEGRALLAVFIACMVAMGFIFCCSFAFLYLQSQTTIHRSLLQCYGIATVLSFYAINFFLDP